MTVQFAVESVSSLSWNTHVYLKGYATMGDLMLGLAEYFVFYNGARPHQSLGDQTPDVVHQTATGNPRNLAHSHAGL